MDDETRYINSLQPGWRGEREDCDGPKGAYGPNDDGYLCVAIRQIAERLQDLSRLWCEGHYPHSNAKAMPTNHPIATALSVLALYDQQICVYGNLRHTPDLFRPYQPSTEAQTRWDKQQ